MGRERLELAPKLESARVIHGQKNEAKNNTERILGSRDLCWATEASGWAVFWLSSGRF